MMKNYILAGVIAVLPILGCGGFGPVPVDFDVNFIFLDEGPDGAEGNAEIDVSSDFCVQENTDTGVFQTFIEATIAANLINEPGSQVLANDLFYFLSSVNITYTPNKPEAALFVDDPTNDDNVQKIEVAYTPPTIAPFSTRPIGQNSIQVESNETITIPFFTFEMKDRFITDMRTNLFPVYEANNLDTNTIAIENVLYDYEVELVFNDKGELPEAGTTDTISKFVYGSISIGDVLRCEQN